MVQLRETKNGSMKRLKGIEDVQENCCGLHKCTEDCERRCPLLMREAVIAAFTLEVSCDVFTDQVYHELINDEDCKFLYLTILRRVWNENDLELTGYDNTLTLRNVQICTSLYKIARKTLEKQPLFLGWLERSKFYKQL